MSIPALHGSTAAALLRRLFPNLFEPALGTAPRADLQGALAGALASIPQTLAYGLIIGTALGGAYSGIGVLAALYGSVIVGLAAALLGGCPLLVAGPRAGTLLVFAALITQLRQAPALAAGADPALQALVLACAAALAAGLLQMLFAVLRLGRLVNYVPLPVIAGFINSSALLIMLSQVWPATGVPAQKSVLALFTHIEQIRPATLALAATTAALLLLLPRVFKRGPVALLVVSCATVVYHLLAAVGWGAALGGTLPAPPEHFAPGPIVTEAGALLSGVHGEALLRLMLPAIVSMAILSTLDTLLATSATDSLTMRRSNGGRQLLAEGFGNALAAFFSLAPGAGSMVRTQAALRGGMQSAAAPLLIALLTLLLTLALAPAIGWLSQAVMAGLLLALGVDLLDRWTLARLRGLFAAGLGAPAARGDLFAVAVVVITTLATDLATAVGVGILVSILSFVLQMAHTPIRRCYRATALIPRIHGDMARRDFIERHGRAIAIVEMEGALFFGSAAEVESRVDALLAEDVVHVVLDLKRVKDVDATGARALERMHHKVQLRGGVLAVSYVDRERRVRKNDFDGRDKRRHALARKIWRKLVYLGTTRIMGDARFFADTDAAVALCESHLAASLPGAAAEAREALRHPPILQAVDRAMLRRLRAYLTRLTYEPGASIVTQDHAPDGAYFVASGRVEVFIKLPGTERRLKVQSLSAGSVFGEMALIDPQPRSASIVALRRTRCYCLSDKAFERLRREHGDLALTLIGNVALIFAERLRATNSMLAEMEA